MTDSAKGVATQDSSAQPVVPQSELVPSKQEIMAPMSPQPQLMEHNNAAHDGHLPGTLVTERFRQLRTGSSPMPSKAECQSTAQPFLVLADHSLMVHLCIAHQMMHGTIKSLQASRE